MKKQKLNNKKAEEKESSEDIINLILNDHKELKSLVKVMKSEDANFADKKQAFEEFAPLLLSHAKPEEKTWYMDMKEQDGMKIEGLEGDVEHSLADQLCNAIKQTKDKDLFMARVKVLAELVEHHIKEEEQEMLPDFKKRSTAEERAELGEKYQQLQALMRSKNNPNNFESVNPETRAQH